MGFQAKLSCSFRWASAKFCDGKASSGISTENRERLACEHRRRQKTRHPKDLVAMVVDLRRQPDIQARVVQWFSISFFAALRADQVRLSSHGCFWIMPHTIARSPS